MFVCLPRLRKTMLADRATTDSYHKMLISVASIF